MNEEFLKGMKNSLKSNNDQILHGSLITVLMKISTPGGVGRVWGCED